ncbi:MAG: hypothetical protein ACI857_001311 [Arenicella sp.]|jgi:hypothetical protein
MTIETLDIDTQSLPVSINDLRDKFYDGLQLELDEFTALNNYDRYRLFYLDTAGSGQEFDKRYLELQAKANLVSYLDFLDFDKIA